LKYLWFSEQFTEPQAASRLLQQALCRGYYLLERFSQLISAFIEASQNIIFYFLDNKAEKNIKTIGAYT